VNTHSRISSRCVCALELFVYKLSVNTGGGTGNGYERAYTRYSFTCFSVCATINHPFITPRPFASPTLLQYDCETVAPYMTFPRPFLYMPYTIHYWQWQYITF